MSQQLLRDPFYGQIIASIAVTVALADKDANEAGQQFTDSQVKAVVHRVIQKLEGKPPKQKEPTSEKERRQAGLYQDLVKLRGTIIVTHRETGEKGPLSPTMYLRAMRAAKDTILQRKTGQPGERGYLEYAKATLDRVEAQPNEEEESAS
ncbi:hypothetical protein OAG85_03670 [Verrucomicrobiales bacterium]|jgi:hypothetical protein|nr:hypothetical protein [Verrucomicrobiales bacterium]MDB2347460.1 hypothetical protein [Verrucomicrobiales bacterium]MDB4809009.1 hypothetical protein [Verrucomicrobiales bacterium]